MIYPIAYALAVLSLVGWFYLQNDRQWSKVMQSLLAAALISWVVASLTAEASLDYKLGVLFRDLMVMGAVGLGATLCLKNKALFAGFFVAVLLVGQHFYWQPLQNTFPQTQQVKEAFVETNEAFNISHFGNDRLAENGELLIEKRENVLSTELEELLKNYQISFRPAFQPMDAESTLLDNYLVLDIPAHQLHNIDEIKADILDSGLAEWIENNEVVNISPIESPGIARPTPDFGINDPGIEYMWGFTSMNVDQLYRYLKTNDIQPQRKARIAILDTGIDAKHEDIQDNYKSIKSKYDSDSKGHGTHCAGIAASVSNNGLGIASFSPNQDFVEVSSIRVLNGFGFGTQQGIINGIIEAADAGVDVISMSLGGLSSDSKQRAYQQAVAYANEKGAIVVVAAGNENSNATRVSPANVEGVITVSAIEEGLKRAVFSNYVTDLKMGIAAPGANIYSTIPNNKYASYNGTSMATPYVAGLLGVMKSLRPDLTTQEAYRILNGTGMNTKNTTETGRLIQPFQAVKRLLD